jgi:2-polyprenyl-3-methyl-5-hydroxy-6-metoxy-1,4-benzoquinol methylase
MKENFEDNVHEANIRLHQIEARYYDLIHLEETNRNEQERIIATLKRIDRLLKDSSKKALDFGAGTGNLTGKLLILGYDVTAVDISKEMCEIMEKKYRDFLILNRLKIINSKVEDMNFRKEKFDLITCYSVLHHLPDYIDVIRRLSFFLRKSGIMYLDHESSPYLWRDCKSISDRMIEIAYFRSLNFYNYRLNRKLLHWRGMEIPSFEYNLSDFWTTETHHLEHEKIKKTVQGGKVYILHERRLLQYFGQKAHELIRGMNGVKFICFQRYLLL